MTNSLAVQAIDLPRHERVALLVEAVGGQRRASEIAEVSPATVNNWRKEGAALSFDGILALCVAAGVSLDWVATGYMVRPDILVRHPGAGTISHPLKDFGRLLPLRSRRERSANGVAIQRVVPSEIAVSEQWLRREFGLSAEQARYAIVEDDGMAPRLGRGALVLLDARPAQPRSGVVLLEGEELLARRLYRMPDGAFELTADGDPNWRFRTDRLDHLPQMHRIVWAGQNL